MFYQLWLKISQGRILMSEVGTHRLTPAGEELRDQLLTQLPTTFQSNRELKERIPEMVDRATIGKIKSNKLVRLSSLEKFFGSLSRHLSQASAFDPDQHATCPVESNEEFSLDPNSNINLAENSPQITDIKLKLKVVPTRPKYSVVGVLLRPNLAKSCETLVSSQAYDERSLVQYLPELISELLTDCGKLVPLTQLVIEWFLPIEFMDLDVERWTFPRGALDWPSGAQCKAVYIRSYERNFEPRYASCHGDWQEIWQRDRNINCDDGLVEISDSQYAVAHLRSGCWFVSPQAQSDREDLWECLITDGVPVVLWARTSSSPTQARPAMLTLLQGAVNELPENLANQRQQVLSPRRQDKMTDELREIAHLSLLWDNPACPFPNSPSSSDSIDYQSA
jgi:hypothetical protein